MLLYGALSGPLPKLGVVAAAALVAVVMLHRDARIQAAAMLGALILAPALLLLDIWHSPQLNVVHRHPLPAALAALVALAALAAAAFLVGRRPALLAGATLVTLPFRIPISTGQQTNNLLVPLYFVIAAGAVCFIFRSLRPGGPATTAGAHVPEAVRWLERLLALYIVLYALQATYSPSFQVALQNTVFFYVPFALAYCLLRRLEWTPRLARNCLALIVGLAVLFALVGFVEYATKSIFLNPKLIAANQNHTYFAVNSVFFDSNIFGRFMALVMVLLGVVLLYARSRRMLLGTIVVLAIVWVGLVLAVSGSSLGALLVGLGTIAALRWKVRRAVFLAVGVVAVAAAVVAITPTTFGLNQGLNGASRGRAGLISGGLALFKSRPVWGYGSGSFQKEYGARPHGLGRTTTASHTIPVTIAAEQGLVGELAYVAFVIAALVALLQRARGDPARIAIAAAFVALLFHTMLYADFLEDPITWALLAIGAALARGRAGDSLPGRGELAAGGRELQQQLA